uniref:UDP-glycosyltransferase 71E1-like n=1 Tax=Erigeron canadensis TaxID=72917 RepID=UPI001CB8D265|nr:UDP-glycosyltransferase 71E1-like [Erigeron canadensis]
MTFSELVFVPYPGSGHLPQTIELAKLLIHLNRRLSVTIIIMNLPLQEKHETLESSSRLRFINIPCEEPAKDLISGTTFLSAFIEHHKTHVQNIVNQCITNPSSVKLVGFVVDMFCVAMIDVANEFKVPTYIYFTSSAATLGQIFYLQAKRDVEEYDVTELKNSRSDLLIPSYVNPVPTRVIPLVVFDKGGSKIYLDLAIRYREAKGIIVNTFQELEVQGIEALLSSYTNIPPIFQVGPIINHNNPSKDGKTEELIITWLNDQPESSVVFLCFGSMGSFNEKQVKEIAVALERSGHRFLWSLRRPPLTSGFMEDLEEYENLDEVLPEGFLERTSSMGKVIGWAPQMAILSHPSVGGFVSHCGWNSILESIWCGVPIAAWPIYAEQQINAFQLVVDLGLAAEIKIDYQKEMNVTAEEIVKGMHKLMNDEELRRKVKEMKDKSRLTVSKGGYSNTSIEDFLGHLMINN